MSDKNKILERLKELGLIDSKVSQNLSMSFDDFIKNEADNEVQMLEEVVRIKEKKSNGFELSKVESMFYEYFLKKYSY